MISKSALQSLTWDELHYRIQNTRLFQKFIPKTVSVDWGKKPRGQGRRSGGMVLGAMSDAPTGVKHYINYCGNVPEYTTHFDDFKLMCQFEINNYLKAREYGLNHLQAKVYSIVASGKIKLSGEKTMQRLDFYSEAV